MVCIDRSLINTECMQSDVLQLTSCILPDPQLDLTQCGNCLNLSMQNKMHFLHHLNQNSRASGIFHCWLKLQLPCGIAERSWVTYMGHTHGSHTSRYYFFKVSSALRIQTYCSFYILYFSYYIARKYVILDACCVLVPVS